MHDTRAGRLLAALVTALLASCCPDPVAQDSGNRSDGGAARAVRYTVLQRELFDRHCVTDCHQVGNAGAGLILSAPGSYLALVNQRSQQITSRYLVLPGNPTESYLLNKLEGVNDFVGDRMPKGAPRRPRTEIEEVRIWITRGAPND